MVLVDCRAHVYSIEKKKKKNSLLSISSSISIHSNYKNEILLIFFLLFVHVNVVKKILSLLYLPNEWCIVSTNNNIIAYDTLYIIIQCKI